MFYDQIMIYKFQGFETEGFLKYEGKNILILFQTHLFKPIKIQLFDPRLAFVARHFSCF